MSNKTIFLGCDHRGYKLKEALKKELIKKRIDLVDFTPIFDPNDDFSDFAKRVAIQVSKGKGRGILICGTGIGMSIAANRFKKIRAALVHTIEEVKLSRMHSNSNIIVLGGNHTKPDLAKKMLSVWLKTSFLGRKYKRRMDKTNKL